MPETRAQTNTSEPANLEIISLLINDSTKKLEESLSTKLAQLTEEVRKVNDTLVNQQQDILAIRDVIIKNLQAENSFIKDRLAKLEENVLEQHNVNLVLKGELSAQNKQIEELERSAYRTAEYVNYETLEVSNIPISIPVAEVPQVTLAIINALGETGDEALDLTDVHAIHRRQGKFTNERVLVKFVRRGDAFFTLQKAKQLRKMDLKTIDKRLTKPVYINEHLSPYYGKL